MSNDILTNRKGLDEICSVPKHIISVYSLEKHVWAHANAKEARKNRQPELQTVDEFLFDPVRAFFMDVLRKMAAPYWPERRDEPIGQGYWIQAEFGSGKSHILSVLSALALGDQRAWDIVREKEQSAGRGKRESLYRFWQEGIKSKGKDGKRGIFVCVKTLVGVGGHVAGQDKDKGRDLCEYILDAVKEQLEIELGRNVSLYPAELLVDRFLSQDLDRYRNDLRKFLCDPKFFAEDEFEDIGKFIQEMQDDRSPEYKRSCGNKLWRFYDEYLKVRPQIETEAEELLKHMVETILAEGYSGFLLVLDEVSIFMKDRDEQLRTGDEKTLVVLSNRLAKVHNLPIWTVCTAQQAIESKMGVKNIIAADRLKLVTLLEKHADYYDIVLSRVREIKDSSAVGPYYLHYKRGFTWPSAIGEDEFEHFFPFHKPALEVLRPITFELTTSRSAIHFMHQTLKHQVKSKGKQLIRLWELFDETVRYEEDPSGVHASLASIKTSRESEYKAYEACKRQIDGLTGGYLRHHHDKAIKILQTLFLVHIARTKQQGMSSEEIANSVLIEKDSEATPNENIQHYETLAEKLNTELRQVVQTFDDEGRRLYRFDPVITGIDPNARFKKARDDAESNEKRRKEAWEQLLFLGEWTVKTRNMTLDLSNGIISIFHELPTLEEAKYARSAGAKIEIEWAGREVFGEVSMCDLARINPDGFALNSSETDYDFKVFISTGPIPDDRLDSFLNSTKDPRILLWTPGELTSDEEDRLLDFTAYRKLAQEFGGEETEDAVAVINWVYGKLQTELAAIKGIVDNSYGRGRIASRENTRMGFHVAGGLQSILTPVAGQVLDSTYASRDIRFEHPHKFTKDEGVKVINGIVKTGEIPKGARADRNVSAVQNYGLGLKLVRRGAERILDTSENPHVRDMWRFIDDKLSDEGQTMSVQTLYKNFMGIGGPEDYGLTRRMVQIFLLCLVREGKIRAGISPKSGLRHPAIDYGNISGVNFSVKVLDSLTDIRKVGKPENWDVLRPYAEKLLESEIPETHHEALIAKYRRDLRDLLVLEREKAPRLESRSRSLFEFLKAENPYETELGQAVNLFSADIESGDDINQILYILKKTFHYMPYDEGPASQDEVDDLANRLRASSRVMR